MAKVTIAETLKDEILKKFKEESKIVFRLMLSLETKPKKGKLLGQVGGVAIKELKYKVFRFYFITDEYKIKILSEQELGDLLIRFVRMSDKKDQQKVIDEIKGVLRNFGDQAFKD